MVYFNEKNDDDFDFDNLSEGVYSFSGLEGFVKVEIDKNGHQSWNLENWFATLDPDKNEMERPNIIQDIKRRIDFDKGIINPPKKRSKKRLFNLFQNKL